MRVGLVLLFLSGCADMPSGAAEGEPCAATADCRADLTCDRARRTCRRASDLPLGEACRADAQCRSGACDARGHYCTAPCSAQVNCAVGTACTYVPTSGGKRCRPTCEADGDCAVYILRLEAPLTCHSAPVDATTTARVCLGRPDA